MDVDLTQQNISTQQNHKPSQAFNLALNEANLAALGGKGPKFEPQSVGSGAQNRLETPGRGGSDRGLGDSPVAFEDDHDLNIEDIGSISQRMHELDKSASQASQRSVSRAGQ